MGDALSQKTNARRVLAILVGLLATFLALQGIASMGSGGFAFAQDPTPTNTTSGRAIKIINPDSTTSNEISNKSDGVDTAYHLVAWVNTPQTGDVVEFKYVPSNENVEINIQCTETGTSQARFVSPDTYECHWDLSNVPEGSETGTIRAVLYANGNVVATDEEAARIDRTGQTVEITYPVNGGPMGFYTRPDGTSVGMIDFRTSGSTGANDEGTQTVIAYYSISEPGTEPAFTRCSAPSVATTGGTQDSVRCTLPADDPGTSANEARRPEQVTAVAVVPRDINEGPLPSPPTGPDPDASPDPDAADGHRALGYSQDPRSALIDPQTHAATPGTCSQVIAATVLDQNERKVVGVNVDVHAQGPTDNLHFDDTDSTSDNSSSHQPPENHPTESTVNCESQDSPRPFNSDSLQGEHDQIGPNDVKHIESTAPGTDNNGQFRFQLYTPDTGTTQFTAWADEDGNDRFCAEEAHGNGSIGWNAAAPSPTGVAAEDTTCPAASPSPTATATASPTGSPTASPTGTASPSPTGTASPSPTGTASPSPSPSPTDDQGAIVQSGPCEGHREGSRSQRQGGGEVIVGTHGPDELEGSSGDDLICALSGRDVVRGRGGDDQIHGDRGHDDLRGNQGNDSIFGSRGLDVIRGGAGNDEIRGGGQDDTIRGYTGRDRIFGGGGNDTIRAGAHNDHLRGNAGDDVLVGGPGNDNCGGGRGDDRLIRC